MWRARALDVPVLEPFFVGSNAGGDSTVEPQALRRTSSGPFTHLNEAFLSLALT